MKFQYVRKSNEGTLMKSRDAYRYLSYGMSTVGWLSPPNRWGCQWPYRLWSSIVMVMAFYLPCGMFISYAREFHNFKPEELFTSLQAAINAPGAFCRGMLSFLGMWRLHKLMDTLDKMDKRCISQAEQIKVHEIVGRCNMIFLFYVTCYFLYATCTFAAALSRGQTPYGLYNPLVDSQKHLYMSGFIEYMLLSAGLYYNLMTDVFTLIFGFTVRLHLSLLSDRIQQLHIPDSKTEAEYNDALVDCIKDYKHIINICNLMRPYISANVFVQYLISGMVFGITLINVLFFGDLWSKVPSAFYMTALVLQQFPFSFCCNLIEKDCDALTLSVFQAFRYEANKKYHTALSCFLQLTHTPITFTAGKIFNICMATNISVAKLAFSVVTFVKEMNIADKLKAD